MSRALLERVETRVAQIRERGEDVRIDDTPEVLSKRLASYRAQTEPLVHYYSEKRKLMGELAAPQLTECLINPLFVDPAFAGARHRKGEAPAEFSPDHRALTLTIKTVSEGLFSRAARKGRQLFGLDMGRPAVSRKQTQPGGVTASGWAAGEAA